MLEKLIGTFTGNPLYQLGAVLLLVLAFFTYRAALIHKGHTEGYAEAEAVYKPKLESVNRQLEEWKTSQRSWMDAHASLKKKLAEQQAQIAANDAAAKARLEAARNAFASATKNNAKLRDTARAAADELIAMKLPKEKCDALSAIVHTARRLR